MLRGSVQDPMSADVWSLGIVLYSMVVADFPFRNVAEVLQAQFDAMRAPQLSPKLRDLLSRLLVGDAAARPRIEQVKQHPWLAAPLEPDGVHVIGSEGKLVPGNGEVALQLAI